MNKTKISYINLVLVLLCFILFMSGAYYLGRQSIKNIEISGVIPTKAPVVVPTINPVTEWKTYQKSDFSFRYPMKNEQSLSFNEYPNDKHLNIDDFIGLNYQLDKIMVDGQEGRQTCPRAGCEDTFCAEFPTQNQKSFYSICLESNSTDGEKLFHQILSTFKFTNSNQQIVKIYYYNPKLDSNYENIVANDFKEILIPKTSTPLKDSINELLKLFVTEDEKDYGSRVLNFKLKSASIVDGMAKLVFDDPESYTSGGSSRINLIYSQIEKTALQFPSVKKVQITGAVFQP